MLTLTPSLLGRNWLLTRRSLRSGRSPDNACQDYELLTDATGISDHRACLGFSMSKATMTTSLRYIHSILHSKDNKG